MPFLPPNQQRQSTEGTPTNMQYFSFHSAAYSKSQFTDWWIELRYCVPPVPLILNKSFQSRSLGLVHTHTHLFNGPLSRTTQVSRYQKGETNLDFTEARDSEWQWHQLGRMQVCTSLQTDNHTNTSPLSSLQAGCPSCHPTNSVRALKAKVLKA